MIVRKITNIDQLERLLAEQKKKILRQVSPFKNDNEVKQRRRIKRARKDRFYFYQNYLPHYFTADPNWHHLEIDKHLEKRGDTITAIIGGHETGKTVQTAIGYPLHQGIFKHRKFITFIAHTQDLAVERLVSIRAEFENNPRIIHDFGKLENPGLWEMDDFTLASGTRYVALGYGMSPRGKINREQRMDLIIFDDFETKQTARNEKISIEKKEYVLEEAYPMLADNSNLIWLGNLPGKKSAINLFWEETEQGDHAGRFVLYYPIEFSESYVQANRDKLPEETVKTKLLWPAVKDRKWCEKKKGTVGTLTWEREYKLNPVVEGRIFQEEWFREYSTVPHIVRSVMYTDPSFGKRKSACKKAVVLLGWTGKQYILIDAWIRNASVTAMIEAQYAMWNRWRDQGINLTGQWLENNYGQLDRLNHDYAAAAAKHGFRIPTMPHDNKEDKNMRIESCAGLIERGDALFNFENPDQRELRDQFVYYPDHPDLDGPDAFESGIRILKTAATDWKITTVVKRTFQRKRIGM